MNPVVIFERLEPPTTTHHAKKIVRIGGFARLADSKALAEAKDTWDAVLMPHRIEAPIEGPVRLTIVLMWGYLKSEPKKNRDALLRRDTKPDLDNMAKTITDRLVKWGFIKQDSQVCDLSVSKYFGESGGVTIRIEPVERRVA